MRPSNFFFIFCYKISSVLLSIISQCESIGQAIYMTAWYRLPQKEAKNLILMIQTTQRPVYLTAGKLFTLSILTFSNVSLTFTYLMFEDCMANYIIVCR